MHKRAFVFSSLLTAAIALGACGGDENASVSSAGKTETAVSATATAVAQQTVAAATFVSIPTETPVRTITGPDIRQQDLTQQAELSVYLSSSGGMVDPNAIFYADLTNDGGDEAIVPVSSGGEGGDIAVFVFGYVDGQLTQLLRREAEGQSLTASLSDAKLRVTEPVFQDGDPFACPSQLKITTYDWDGSALTVEDEHTEPNSC